MSKTKSGCMPSFVELIGFVAGVIGFLADILTLFESATKPLDTNKPTTFFLQQFFQNVHFSLDDYRWYIFVVLFFGQVMISSYFMRGIFARPQPHLQAIGSSILLNALLAVFQVIFYWRALFGSSDLELMIGIWLLFTIFGVLCGIVINLNQ